MLKNVVSYLSVYKAIVFIPRLRHVCMILHAISPLFAIRIERIEPVMIRRTLQQVYTKSLLMLTRRYTGRVP